MKKLALVFLMLQTAFLLAAPDKPNPADFTVTVHVVSSGSQIYCDSGLCGAYQLLETVIDNQPVELQGGLQNVVALNVKPDKRGKYGARRLYGHASHSVSTAQRTPTAMTSTVDTTC